MSEPQRFLLTPSAQCWRSEGNRRTWPEHETVRVPVFEKPVLLLGGHLALTDKEWKPPGPKMIYFAVVRYQRQTRSFVSGLDPWSTVGTSQSLVLKLSGSRTFLHIRIN